jgi:hypothetical protein
MANTGIVSNTTEPLYSQTTVSVHAPGTAIPFNLNPGTVINNPNMFGSASVRSAILNCDITATGTQQSFAHNLTDADGNPVAPRPYSILSQQGDVWITQEADTKNVYLTSPALAPNTVVLYLQY